VNLRCFSETEGERKVKTGGIAKNKGASGRAYMVVFPRVVYQVVGSLGRRIEPWQMLVTAM
jgi:hypothetical protein